MTDTGCHGCIFFCNYCRSDKQNKGCCKILGSEWDLETERIKKGCRNKRTEQEDLEDLE